MLTTCGARVTSVVSENRSIVPQASVISTQSLSKFEGLPLGADDLREMHPIVSHNPPDVDQNIQIRRASVVSKNSITLQFHPLASGRSERARWVWSASIGWIDLDLVRGRMSGKSYSGRVLSGLLLPNIFGPIFSEITICAGTVGTDENEILQSSNIEQSHSGSVAHTQSIRAAEATC